MALSSLQIKMIRRLFQLGTEEKIAHTVEKIHPADLSILFSELNANETGRLINSLFLVQKAGQTLSELPEFMIPDILELIDDQKMAVILSRLEPDDALFLLKKIPESRWKIILEGLPPSQRQQLDQLLLYPRDSAGSVMTSKFIVVKVNMTVEEAVESLRNQVDTEGLFYVYVVDDGGRLVGVQSLRSLVVSKPGTKVREIMKEDVQAVLATATQEEASQIVAQYNLLAVPVVNETRELVGVITVDDVIDILKEEATEDIYHLAGLSEEDRALTTLATKVKKRLPWMILNLFTAGVAATVVGIFSKSITEVVALAVFMPIVAGVGGNGAYQSLTVIVRSIALGEMEFIKPYKAILKEAGNGLILGAILGLLIGCVGYFWQGSFYFGLVLFVSTMLNLVMGGFMGAMVPITFKKLGLDPALGSNVLVTMCTDALGFFFFLGSATLMLQYLKT